MRTTQLNFLILPLLVTYTICKAIQLFPTHAALTTSISLLLLFVMVSWFFIYNAKPQLINSIGFKLFVWLGSSLMGFWTTFILFSLPIDLILLINYAISSLINTATYNPENIFLLAKKTNIVVTSFSALFTVLGFIQVIAGPKIKNIFIPIKHLPQSLQHFKIAQISDLHVGPTIRKKYVEKVVRKTNLTHPDIIVITGDLIDANPALVMDDLQPLANLKPSIAKYYVTGNHEYYWGAENIISTMEKLGFIPLINDNRIINVAGVNILIAGITDDVGGNFMAGHHPDLEAALRTKEPTEFKILLAHRPGIYLLAEQLGVNLQLSGHTHGGQFFPFNLLIPLAHKYYHRLHQYKNLWLYVNPGTGYWGPANRLGVPAEITLCHLQLTT